MKSNTSRNFNSYEEGYNQTKGGQGNIGWDPDEIWRIKVSARQRRRFQDPENRWKQSLANKKAHEENPDQAEEHSRFMKERYTYESERNKTSEGMSRYLSDEANYRRHAVERGARWFNVYKGGVFVGQWLSQRACARDLSLKVSHINKCLHGKRKSHGGYTFEYKGG